MVLTCLLYIHEMYIYMYVSYEIEYNQVEYINDRVTCSWILISFLGVLYRYYSISFRRDDTQATTQLLKHLIGVT